MGSGVCRAMNMEAEALGMRTQGLSISVTLALVTLLALIILVNTPDSQAATPDTNEKTAFPSSAVGLRPDLRIGPQTVDGYWASMGDYVNAILTVDQYVISNNSDVYAFNVTIVGTTDSMGVTMLDASAVGDVPPGGSISVTIRYTISPGLNSEFVSRIYATAEDEFGNIHEYPWPYPV